MLGWPLATLSSNAVALLINISTQWVSHIVHCAKNVEKPNRLNIFSATTQLIPKPEQNILGYSELTTTKLWAYLTPSIYPNLSYGLSHPTWSQGSGKNVLSSQMNYCFTATILFLCNGGNFWQISLLHNPAKNPSDISIMLLCPPKSIGAFTSHSHWKYGHFMSGPAGIPPGH